MRTLALTLIFMALNASAFAHGDDPHGTAPHWTFDPWIVTPLAISLACYAIGTAVLWLRSGAGRGILPWQVASYLCGWATLAGALLSPLHWLGEHVFTFHMIEHEIVMAISAPLIVVARPLGAFLWSMPRRLRFAVSRGSRSSGWISCWRFLTSGRNATVLHGIAIWAWHAPVLFDAAVTNILMHRLQHLSFFITALLFWWSILRRSNVGVAAWHVVVTMLHTSVLGALMALAPRVLYTAQTAHAREWGLTPLEDQQLAGIVMWVPAGTIYAGAALILAAMWIKQSGANRRDDDVVSTS